MNASVPCEYACAFVAPYGWCPEACCPIHDSAARQNEDDDAYEVLGPPHRDHSAEFEALAAKFYAETGYLAPGKSVPDALASVTYDDERRHAWDQWQKKNRVSS